MRTEKIFLLLVTLFFMFLVCTATQASGEGKGKVPTVMQMTIRGEIAKGANDVYIIRGKVPAEIFTILNPVPDVLDDFAANGKIVELKVDIVSGDNVEIRTIDGKKYPQGVQ